jgi:ATP-dependent Lon protease
MLDPIPGPLRDRMEVIQLAGYTPEEKVEIATRFLIPRQITEHGLVPTQLEWSKNAIERLTAKYTHEAGVRNLERQVAAVCRKVARKAAEGDDASVRVTQRTLARYLGPPRFEDDFSARENEIGVVQGLAWTEAGGDVLTLEANLASGKGLTLTGQLGDVMKESGQTAHSFVRSLLREIDADDSVLSRNETHVHVPAGATPKDGPSAGVTIATAILSIATGIPVRGDVAMTGEITLRGRVLPVGGVREKALAALRSGITTIILPRGSMRDADEIPRDLRRKLELIPVSHMREVLDHALVEPLRWRASPVRAPHGAQPVPSAAVARKR